MSKEFWRTYEGTGILICSRCGECVDACDDEHSLEDMSICPNCKSEMDEEVFVHSERD